MDGAVDIELAGQRLSLLADRAAWWPARRGLLVADVHLGKGAVFRAHGMAVPAGSSATDLARLSRLVTRHRARELWVLGDMFHGPQVEGLAERVARWRDALGACEVLLVHGNHDRKVTLPARWRMHSVDERTVDGIALRHELEAVPADAGIAGHVHPTVRLGGGRGDRLRAPAFWLRGNHLVLPAFGSFTGGQDIAPSAGERLFAVGPGAVVEVTPAAALP